MEQCVILCVRRYFVVRMCRRCGCVPARKWRLDTVCWFMVGCVALRVYCHALGSHKCKMRLSCVLNTVVDLAAAALCIDWPGGGKLSRVNIV